MSNDRNQIPMTPGLEPQNAKPVFLTMKGDPLDKAGENLGATF